MNQENYLWYSKAVLATITFFIFLGILIRWRAETKVRRSLAYMALLLTLIFVVDVVLCQYFEYHPLMVKSGSSFGTLFLSFIVLSFSCLYSLQFFENVGVTRRLILKLTWPLGVVALCYMVLVALNVEPLPRYDLWGVVDNSVSNYFALLWLLATIGFLAYALYASVRLLSWTLVCARKKSMAQKCILFGLYAIFEFAVILVVLFFSIEMNSSMEALCFMATSVTLLAAYILSYFQSMICVDEKLLDSTVPQSPEQSSEQHFIRISDRLLIDKLNVLMNHDLIYTQTDLTTEVMAHSLGISRKKLYLFLKEHYDSTFLDYVNGRRLEHAEKLMDESENLNLSMAQIAEMSGFNSLKTFSKTFKIKHSITPAKYRNSIEFLDS